MTRARDTLNPNPGPRLELVVKADSIGSVEAVSEAVGLMEMPRVAVGIVKSGVGVVSQSDVLLAETSGRLIIGFQVGVMPGLAKTLMERRVEVRLYNVIYELISDLKTIAEGLAPHAPAERIMGAARIIALFKSGRKGLIIGCQVLEGSLVVGERFRVISAMGPVYGGHIESLHIGDHAVQKAAAGQQAGIRIRDFKGARLGDLVESFRPEATTAGRAWEPSGKIILRNTAIPRKPAG